MRQIILGAMFLSAMFSGCNPSSGSDDTNTTLSSTSDTVGQLPYEENTQEVVGKTVYLLQKSETDSNMDGSVDEKTIYSYNTNNDKKMVQTVTIENNTETVDETIRYYYDEQNHLTSQATYDADGKITDSYQYSYIDGYLSKIVNTSSSTYSDTVYTTIYDATGNELTYEHQHEYDYGYGINGYTHYIEIYHYNDVNKQTHTVYQEISEDGTRGSEIVISRYTYDNTGRVATWQYDYDEDGIFDYTEYDYEYDGSGKVLKYFYDDETTVNNYAIFEYNTAGEKTKEAEYDSTGKLLYESLATYDTNGEILLWTYDSDGDSTIDWQESYEYNTHGDLILETGFWKSSSSTYYFNYTYEYDENGLLIGETNSENVQGIPEEEIWHTWITAD